MAAIFPGAVATQIELLTAQNNTKVLLDVNAGIADTTITVDDASALPASGYLTFNDDEDSPETISYTGKSGNDLTGVTRGDDGTAAGTHTADGTTALEMRWNAKYHNILADELIAVETNLSARLGLSATQILAPLGSVSAPSHGFTGDVNTGMYSTGADAIDFATGGVRALGITSAQAIQIPKTSNQLVIGTTNTATVSFTAPAASRVYTIADAGASANFVMSEGSQTLNGALALAAALTITPTTNQLVLGTTRTVTITAPTPASSSRTWTIPDLSTSPTFAALEGTQTFSGAKTFESSALLLKESGGGSDAVTIAVASLATSRTYTVPDAGGSADFVMNAGTQTIAGAKTFSSPILSSDGSNSAPGYSFSSDTDTGIYRSGSNNLDIAIGGSNILNLTGTAISATGAKYLNINGTSGAPSYSFAAATALGIYNDGGDLGLAVPTGQSLAFRVNGAQIVVCSATNLLPVGAGAVSSGTAANYWNDISYKTLTDRGCLPWCDDGVEVYSDQKRIKTEIVSDLEAICRIRKHPTQKTIHGLPKLDYASFPVKAYRPADLDVTVVERDNDDNPWYVAADGTKTMAADGVEMTMVFGVMIGAIKELNGRIAALEAAKQP